MGYLPSWLTKLFERFGRPAQSIVVLDPEFVGKLLASIGKGLRRCAWWYTRDEDEAEDLVQEAATSVMSKRKDVPNPKAYMYGAVRNQGKTYLKKKRAKTNMTEEPATKDHMDVIEKDEERKLLADAIKRLPSEQREVVELVYLEGLSHEQAAARLNLKVNTVNSRLLRARQELKDKLNPGS